jgi:hypothetical protein
MEFFIGQGRTVSLHANESLRLFHGTDTASATSIVETGPHPDMAIEHGGTGDFWTTVDLSKAIQYGAVSYGVNLEVDTALYVVSFDLPVSVIEDCLSRPVPTLWFHEDNTVLEFKAPGLRRVAQAMTNVTVIELSVNNPEAQ